MGSNLAANIATGIAPLRWPTPGKAKALAKCKLTEAAVQTALAGRPGADDVLAARAVNGKTVMWRSELSSD
jgi:hypothetical protein